MMDIIFIADVYADEIPGGGELVNDLVIEELINRGHNVVKYKSENVELEKLHNYLLNKYTVILANHLLLPIEQKNMLARYSRDYGCKYIIYEHDHKYLNSRDPSKYKDFTAPDETYINGPSLYDHAFAVLCQSKIHRDVLLRNVPTAGAVNLKCSIWSDDFIDAATNLKIKNCSWR